MPTKEARSEGIKASVATETAAQARRMRLMLARLQELEKENSRLKGQLLSNDGA